MSLVQRNITRTIKVATETTLQTKEANADALAFALTAGQYFYVGSRNHFACRYFHFATLNVTANTLVVEYWNGSAWVAVTDLVDQTQGFTRNGFVSWENESAWAKSEQAPVDYEELYWIRFSVSAGLHASTSLQAVLNLFCDNTLVKKYYPALIDDSRYLPESRTDFLEQYEAARDYVLLRLKQDHIIEDESQVIDPNEVCVAAVHAFAFLLLSPITDPEEDKRAVQAERAMNHELNRVRLSLDLNKSGKIEESERNFADVFVPRGGF